MLPIFVARGLKGPSLNSALGGLVPSVSKKLLSNLSYYTSEIGVQFQRDKSRVVFTLTTIITGMVTEVTPSNTKRRGGGGGAQRTNKKKEHTQRQKKKPPY
jgi:hypothetical protein